MRAILEQDVFPGLDRVDPLDNHDLPDPIPPKLSENVPALCQELMEAMMAVEEGLGVLEEHVTEMMEGIWRH